MYSLSPNSTLVRYVCMYVCVCVCVMSMQVCVCACYRDTSGIHVHLRYAVLISSRRDWQIQKAVSTNTSWLMLIL